MLSAFPKLLLASLLVSFACSGCGLTGPLLDYGGNGRMGELLNYSCGAHPCDPIDPVKPTIVFTHGWNPLPNAIHVTFGQAAAESVRCCYGDSCNLLSWDWSAVRVPPFNNAPILLGREQGKKLAAALRRRGICPPNTQLVGHSLGTVIVAQAARCLRDQGPMCQLTLLDPPKMMHEELFCHLAAARHAGVVENYWAPGISGFGAHADYAGVLNFRVEGSTPVRGMVDLSISNHMHVMEWYYQTICSPACNYGFQQSRVLRNQECLGESVLGPQMVSSVTDPFITR